MKRSNPQKSSHQLYSHNYASQNTNRNHPGYLPSSTDTISSHPPPSNFNSPTVASMESVYGSGHFSEMGYNASGVGLGLNWGGSYGLQSEVLPSNSVGQGQMIPQHPHNGFPPTPRSTDSESARHMGSARSSSTGFEGSPTTLKSNADLMPVAKPAKGRKSRANKTTNTKTPKLEAPLSELTKNMTHVPVRDMEAWVNRSIEERQKEVEKRKGYVTRPMNSFMLYRSAYAERTKMWCLQNNHQVVSSVSGESWPLEPTEVRERYNELARIERENHAKAHPTYKFSPSKLGASAARRKKDADVSDGEDEDIRSSDDGEWIPGAGPGNNKRRKSVAGSAEESAYYSPPHSPFTVNDATFANHSVLPSQGFKQLPTPITTSPSFFDNYSFSPHHELSPALMNDMRIRNVPSPALIAQQQQIIAAQQQQHAAAHSLQPLASLPGSNGKYPMGPSVHDFQQQLDPHLLDCSNGFGYANGSLVVADDGSGQAYNPEAFSFDEGAHPAFTEAFFVHGNGGRYDDMLDHQM